MVICGIDDQQTNGLWCLSGRWADVRSRAGLMQRGLVVASGFSDYEAGVALQLKELH